MPSKDQAIRVEVVGVGTGSSHRVYTFPCVDCSREIQIRAHKIARHSGRCRNCSALSKIPMWKAAATKALTKYTRPFERLHAHVIKHGQRNGHTCTLTYEAFMALVAQKQCSYCGALITWRERSQRYNLDRIDHSLGYTNDNVVVSCFRCNCIKGRLEGLGFVFPRTVELLKEVLTLKERNA